MHCEQRFMIHRTLVALLGLLACAGSAEAHRLDAQAFLRGGQLQVEAWFSSGEPAGGARVQVYKGDQVIAEGEMDQKGIFICPLKKGGALRIVVSAGLEHRKELQV